jgi:hypothetical protein
MAAALHGATFDKAKDLRASMTPAQLRDFATGPVAPGPSVRDALGPAPPPPAAKKVPARPTRPKGY